MRRLMGVAVMAMALAGCSSAPAPVPVATATSPVASMSDARTLDAVRAKVCTADNPEPWDTCVEEAGRYLSLALQIHDEMVAAGTATLEMGETARNISVLLARCRPPNPTKSNTEECRYTFDTIRSTGLTFQSQIAIAARPK